MDLGKDVPSVIVYSQLEKFFSTAITQGSFNREKLVNENKNV